MSEIIESIARTNKDAEYECGNRSGTYHGDASKGFAVVAEELSRLAAAALESSHDIGGTIKQVVTVAAALEPPVMNSINLSKKFICKRILFIHR